MSSVTEHSGVHKIPSSKLRNMKIIENIDTENLSFRVLNGLLDLIDARKNMKNEAAIKIASEQDEYYEIFFNLMDILPEENRTVRKLLVVKTIEAIDSKEDGISNIFRFILGTLLDFYQNELENNEANMLIISELNDYVDGLSSQTGILRSFFDNVISRRLVEE